MSRLQKITTCRSSAGRPGVNTFALGSGADVEVPVRRVHLQSLLDEPERGGLIALDLIKLHWEPIGLISFNQAFITALH